MANRFETPVATPMNVEFFTPNMELWAQTLAGQQQRYNTWLSERTKLPEYDARADQSVFDEFMTGSQAEVDRIASAYTDDVLAGNKAMRDALLQVNRDWNPGGTAYNLAQRKAAFQGYKDLINENYEDSVVSNYLIDRMYNNPRNAFYNEDGTFQMPVGEQATSFLSREDRRKEFEYTMKLLSEDEVLNEKYPNIIGRVKGLVSAGDFNTAYSTITQIKGYDKDRIMRTINNSLSSVVGPYGRLEQKAYGVVGEDAPDDPGMAFSKNEETGQWEANAAFPYINELIGLAGSKPEITDIDTSIIKMRNTQKEIEYQKDYGTPPAVTYDGSAQSVPSGGAFGANVSVDNYKEQHAAAHISYDEYMRGTAAQFEVKEPDGSTRPMTAQELEDIYNSSVPGYARSRLGDNIYDKISQEKAYLAQLDLQKQDIDEAYNDRMRSQLGDQKFNQWQNLRQEIQTESERYAAEKGGIFNNMTPEEIASIDFDYETYTDPTGTRQRDLVYTVNGRVIRTTGEDARNLQGLIDMRERMREPYEQAEDGAREYTNNLLDQNTIFTPELRNQVPVRNLNTMEPDAAASRQYTEEARERLTNMAVAADQQVYSPLTGDRIPFDQAFNQLNQAIFEGDLTAAQIKALAVTDKGFSMQTDPRTGVQYYEGSVPDPSNNYEPMTIRVPVGGDVGERLSNDGLTNQELGLGLTNPDPEVRGRANDIYQNVQSNQDWNYSLHNARQAPNRSRDVVYGTNIQAGVWQNATGPNSIPIGTTEGGAVRGKVYVATPRTVNTSSGTYRIGEDENGKPEVFRTEEEVRRWKELVRRTISNPNILEENPEFDYYKQ